MRKEHSPATNRMDKAQIDRTIIFSASAGRAYYVPILRSIRDDNLACLNVVRNGGNIPPVWPKWRPRLVIIGDDDGQASGPTGFAAALLRSFFQRPAGVIVHASGAEEAHYALAVQNALYGTEGQRLSVMVETTSAFAEEWVNFSLLYALTIKPFVIHPPPGLFHPLPEVRQ